MKVTVAGKEYEARVLEGNDLHLYVPALGDRIRIGANPFCDKCTGIGELDYGDYGPMIGPCDACFPEREVELIVSIRIKTQYPDRVMKTLTEGNKNEISYYVRENGWSNNLEVKTVRLVEKDGD